MGGVECMKKLLEIDPEVKAIISSGYVDNPIMSKYRESGFKGIIIKPYEIEELSEILYKILNNNPGVACPEKRTL
jgi:DNA-binding NarL/FixJ family response regulator